MTGSSYAIQACLLNCSDPELPYKKLFLPFLPEEIYQEFEKSLLGGYSTTQAFYVNFNHGRVSLFKGDSDQNSMVSWAGFHDGNSLYPTVSA